ncbi:anhydro-N-acetylmuramic acid kinase [Aestuariimicrobium sp. p3-SID1156]|uniref:anhydro-N-acetylmuramic acid kinase n=1 Tax=Aestuariimicrobium sp. p3-SID1156 TaxID=2916038 RepID=UPI00223A78DE|nr:anhydro-N-acetylmuramic acid kinase [Aestuariimicrobium sp. p3-SID1156]MCT1458231.1 anhydro-N-acetylmuramic acid kinase [Aestuariimicrobium sp. p3-SID1156]
MASPSRPTPDRARGERDDLRVLGMMSGTSVDAIDAALVEFSVQGATLSARVVGFREMSMPDALREELLSVLPGGSGDVERGGPAQWCRLDTDMGQAYARAAVAALKELGPADLVSMHGQTLFHWVEGGVTRGSLQIGNPAWVAEATGLPVVSDLRSADIAAGGQGAPLASTLDALWLRGSQSAALNLGGIANLTLVDGRRVLCGDTGPANCLMDALAMREFGLPHDAEGRIAASGAVDHGALEALIADPYFAQPMPKSTGREYFHLGWLSDRLAGIGPLSPTDLMATVAELTARSVADALARARAEGWAIERLVASGGGTKNPVLMRRLEALSGIQCARSDQLGVPSQAKESVLFALLGWLAVHGLSGTVSGTEGPVTGARATRVLGSLTPATPLNCSPPTLAPPTHAPPTHEPLNVSHMTELAELVIVREDT